MTDDRCYWSTDVARCLWCFFPDPRVVSEIEQLKGRWCGGSCATSFFERHRRHIPRLQYTRLLQNLLHEPDDAEWHCAPEPFEYEWVTPGGLPRSEFLAKCTVFYHRRRVPRSLDLNPHETQSIRSLFESITPAVARPEKKRKLVVNNVKK